MYNGPTITAAEVLRLFENNRDQVRILDVAAGTGFLGVKVIGDTVSYKVCLPYST